MKSCLLLILAVTAGLVVPTQDRRLTEIRTLNDVYTFTPYPTKEAWLARAAHLRRQVLASAGLLPMPVRTPLNAQVFGRIERDGYTIEKVYFESHPGFLVTGNLYRPTGKQGPFPGVLSSHGHWQYGRLENSNIGSVPGRAVNLARQGYVVFSYDMVGYNDSTPLLHRGFGGPTEELWSLSVGGLQLWNSIRALDFLESLPDVDKNRLASTGASGGATQTFLLTAVDDRVKVAAPVNMVSAHMQGGCLCENLPGLRIDTFNVELAALAAPRPVLLVSATGDWTKNTLEVEYPAVRSIYRLLGAEERVHAVRVDAEHNYNRESREAVYAWLHKWLLDAPENPPKDARFSVEPLAQLLVFYGRERPRDEVDAPRLTAYLIDKAKQQLDALRPRHVKNLEQFRSTFRPAYALALAAHAPSPSDVVVQRTKLNRLFLGRKDRGDRIPAALWQPRARRPEIATLVVHEAGIAGVTRANDLVRALTTRGHLVSAIDAFGIGDAQTTARKEAEFFTTYNRTDLANRVQDILTALTWLNAQGVKQVNLIGLGRAGVWSLLARGLHPAPGRTIVDAARFDAGDDRAFVRDLFAPGLRRAGDLRTAAALITPSPLLIHNTGDRFPTEWMADVYSALDARRALQISAQLVPQAEMINWLQR